MAARLSLDARVDLGGLAEAARAAGRLGVDTEFISEGRYRALLCLVGVVVPGDAGHARPEGSGEPRRGAPVNRVELVDPLDRRLDPTPLAEVLADPAVEVVLHAGRQDVALLRRVWRTEVRGVFDTQVAAGFAGFGAQTGYGSLLNDVLGLRLAKSASFTRWDDRPLSPEQLAYARDDVAHLLRLADALQERLAATGRLQWAREECRRLEEASDERDPWLAWQRLPRIGEVPVLLARTASGPTALVERCGHHAGPLGDGKVVQIDGADCVVCPLHGSTFRLADGLVMHGPAGSNQPLLRVRVQGGRIQVALP